MVLASSHPVPQAAARRIGPVAEAPPSGKAPTGVRRPVRQHRELEASSPREHPPISEPSPPVRTPVASAYYPPPRSHHLLICGSHRYSVTPAAQGHQPRAQKPGAGQNDDADTGGPEVATQVAAVRGRAGFAPWPSVP